MYKGPPPGWMMSRSDEDPSAPDMAGNVHGLVDDGVTGAGGVNEEYVMRRINEITSRTSSKGVKDPILTAVATGETSNMTPYPQPAETYHGMPYDYAMYQPQQGKTPLSHFPMDNSALSGYSHMMTLPNASMMSNLHTNYPKVDLEPPASSRRRQRVPAQGVVSVAATNKAQHSKAGKTVRITKPKARGGAEGRKYECTICGKCFNQSGNLNRHRVVHSKERQFKCDICGKGFSQKSHVRTHQTVHTGIKAFECDVCHKRFSQLGHLNGHIDRHKKALAAAGSTKLANAPSDIAAALQKKTAKDAAKAPATPKV